MKHRPTRRIDLMKSISDKQAQDLQQVINDSQKQLKKLNKKPAM